MKYIFFFLSIILFFTGCQNKDLSTPSLKKYNSFDKFDYSKENIAFFEREFKNILTIENLESLEKYKTFYKENSNYFLNGKQKVEEIENKLKKLKEANIQSDLDLLQKAKTLEKKEALKIYKELAKKDNVKAKRELVNIYKYTNPDRALKWLENLVDSKDFHSMKEYASGNIYMVRPIIIQDLKKALETYEKLANFGDLSSIMRLGNIYEYGYHKEVAKKDKIKALEYYELAASKGYLLAQKKLYKIYSCKDCKPNRYNIEKANALQKYLIKDLDNEISKKREKIALKEVQKKQIPLIKKEESEVAILSKNIKTKLPKITTIKCYDMEIANAKLTKTCKNKINVVLEKNKKISKINITAILDNKDKQYYEKEVSNKKFTEQLLKALSNDRLFETVWYLQKKLKDDSIINVSTFYAKSKKKNKGVIIKFY